MNNIEYIPHAAQAPTPGMRDLARIMIVDDQRFDRARLGRMCKELTFDVDISEADSLETLGAAMEIDTFDLIFLDYHMPDGSGLQALEAVQRDVRNRHAGTIMVTGDAHRRTVISSLKNGCGGFLKKDDMSGKAVRRAAVNALLKVRIIRTLETRQVMPKSSRLI